MNIEELDNKKQIILELKQNHPRHYCQMTKRRHPDIWKEICCFNNTIQCDYTMNSSQMIYNWLYNIVKIPVCPVKGTQLPFYNHNFEYRKFSGRGIFTDEFISNRTKPTKLTNKVKPDYKSIEVRSHSFNELMDLYAKYGLYNMDSNKASQHLTWRHPELKKAIHQYYGLDKDWWHCHKWIRNKVESIKGKVVGYDGSIKQYNNLNEYKRQNRKNKIENAELLSKEETIKRLSDFIKSQKHFHNIYQNLASYQPELVKSVEYYTKHIDVKKFTERVYILLYGKPELLENNTQIHDVFRCFTVGYERRANYYSYTSKGEYEITEFIKSLGFIPKKHRINRKEIDMYIPDLNLGFEYDGIFWHSNAVKTSKYYHIDKTKLANDNDIDLMHIFECDWIYRKNIVKSLIKQKFNKYDTVIDLMKCSIRCNVDRTIINDFITSTTLTLDPNHNHNICAYMNDELVFYITFNILDHNVYKIMHFGGKLNTKFINIEHIFNEMVNNYFKYINNLYMRVDARYYNLKRNIFNDLGFTFIQLNEPIPYYFENTTPTDIQHQSLYLTLLSEDYITPDKENMSAEDYMKQKGYLTIYDCGGYIYKWERK